MKVDAACDRYCASRQGHAATAAFLLGQAMTRLSPHVPGTLVYCCARTAPTVGPFAKAPTFLSLLSGHTVAHGDADEIAQRIDVQF